MVSLLPLGFGFDKKFNFLVLVGYQRKKAVCALRFSWHLIKQNSLGWVLHLVHARVQTAQIVQHEEEEVS